MKKVLFSLLFCTAAGLFSDAQQTPAESLSRKIAGAMRDSLGLSADQHQRVYEVNMQLSGAKMQARSQGQNRDSVGRALQQIENGRDSLYRTILTAEQFDGYRRKKPALVTNN